MYVSNSNKIYQWTMGVAVLACFMSSATPVNAQMPPPTGPVSVIVKKVELKKLDRGMQFQGRVRANEKVDIIARVDGFLREQRIRDGEMVAKGDLLFVIEPDRYQAELAQQRANVDSAAASVKLAQLDLSRNREMYQKKAVSKSTLDQVEATLKQTSAALDREQALLKLSQLNLQYTQIKSPITGQLGSAKFSPGALVGPSLGPLIEIVSKDPMRVEFPVPQKIVIEFQKTGKSKEDGVVRLTLADGEPYSEEGKVLFRGIHADSGTDSVQITAEFANPDDLLINNQLVMVSIGPREINPQLVIPQSALLVDQEGAFVMLVDRDNKVSKRRIATGDQSGSLIVVEQGLEAGEQVIVSGVQKVREGLTVVPTLSEE